MKLFLTNPCRPVSAVIKTPNRFLVDGKGRGVCVNGLHEYRVRFLFVHKSYTHVLFLYQLYRRFVISRNMLADLNYTFYFFFIFFWTHGPLYRVNGVVDSKQFITFSLSLSLRPSLTLVVGKATEMGGRRSKTIIFFDFLVF